ncbi:MAG: response regulator transcription factor [Hydrogenibacillus sp.]|nr:response regulator transcription factor [Hydrogenibacillus sp.]
MMRVLIVDDEPLAREELKYHLAGITDVEICAEAEDGESLMHLLERFRPDAVFLDVEMPKRSGLETLSDWVKRHGATALPLVVFVTAYDRYALEAFDWEAVDYVLKPFDGPRIARTVGRLRERLKQREATTAVRLAGAANQPAGPSGSAAPAGGATAEETLADGRRVSTAPGGRGAAVDSSTASGAGRPALPSGKLLIDDGERLVVVSPAEIVYAEREEREIVLHTTRGTVRSKMALNDLEARLGGGPFLRVHRSYLVNLEYVEAISPWTNGAYTLHLKDAAGSEVPVSRSAAKVLFAKLGWA